MNFLFSLILLFLSPFFLMLYASYALIYIVIFGSKAWDKKMDEERRGRHENKKR